MKNCLFLLFLFLGQFVFGQVSSVDYPRPLHRLDSEQSLNDALFFTVASRANLAKYSEGDQLDYMPDYDANPELAERIFTNYFKRLIEFRKEIYINESYQKNGEELIQAITDLKAKSIRILEHVELFAPWPTLNEANSPTAEMTNIMADCCDYLFWYNSYLFILAHAYEVKDPSTTLTSTRVEFTDRSAYDRKFSTNLALKIPFDGIRERFLFGRELIKRDIEEVIAILDLYLPKLETITAEIPTFNPENEEIYTNSVENIRTVLQANIAQAQHWIDSTKAVSQELRDTVLLYDGLISKYSAAYHATQRKITFNEHRILNWQANIEKLTNESLNVLKELDRLNAIAKSLLQECEEDTANEDCVEFPDSLKKVNELININFVKFESLSQNQTALSDSVIELSETNGKLAVFAGDAYEKFVEARNDYQPIAARYQKNKKDIRAGMRFHERKYSLHQYLEMKFQIAIGEKEDPVMVQLRKALRLRGYPPDPFFPELPKDPIGPWDPGWTDPVRDDLLRNIDLIEKEIDLNKVFRSGF